MGHGGGGAMSAELIEHLFLPAFGGRPTRDPATPRSSSSVGGGWRSRPTRSWSSRCSSRAARSATSPSTAPSTTWRCWARSAGVVDRLHPRGGHGLERLGRIAAADGWAALVAGVRLVTGDTKVVDSGHGDGVFVNTAGIGLIPDGVDIDPSRAAPGDVVIVSGDIGVHGVAVMSCREGLSSAPRCPSDCAPLHGLVAAMIATGADIHALRDPTRGGVAASLNEIADAAKVGITLTSATCRCPRPSGMPVAARPRPALCGQRGQAARLRRVRRRREGPGGYAAHAPAGAGRRVIGVCEAEHPGMVTARTALGGTRMVDLPLGEQLPRIC